MDSASAALDVVPKTYESAVRVLAAAHAAGEVSVEIFHLPDPQQRVVRLIEVSDAFPDGGVERPAPPGGMERVVQSFRWDRRRTFLFARRSPRSLAPNGSNFARGS